jgi:hypothetical protein
LFWILVEEVSVPGYLDSTVFLQAYGDAEYHGGETVLELNFSPHKAREREKEEREREREQVLISVSKACLQSPLHYIC